jgi:hypothetical protein
MYTYKIGLHWYEESALVFNKFVSAYLLPLKWRTEKRRRFKDLWNSFTT